MEELTTNTQEWLKARLDGIGASDAPAIMGNSIYRTKLELWDEKFNKTIPTPEEMKKKEFIFNKGHKIEAWARPGIEFETGLQWQPALFEHKTFPFIRATLDGWQPLISEVWECKYMGKEPWAVLADESLTDKERIPPQYYDQLMQQLFVTGAKVLRLTGVKEEKVDDVKVNKACTLIINRTPEMDEYINKVLAPALFAFWKSVQDGARPEAEKQDVLTIGNEELKNHVINYKAALEQKKDLETKAKKASDKILGKIVETVSNLKSLIEKHPARNHGKMEVEGFKLTEVAGSKSINYELALNSFFEWIKKVKTASPGEMVKAVQGFPDEPSLDKYIKIGKPSFKITVPKPKKEEVVKTKTVTETVKVGEIEQSTTTTETTQKERVDEWKNLNSEQQTIVGESNSFKNPDTGQMPRGWIKKDRKCKIEYLRKYSKKASPAAQKVMIELADKLEQLGKSPEDIGGITFE